MLCKANQFTVMVLLLVAFVTQVFANSVVINKVTASSVSDGYSVSTSSVENKKHQADKMLFSKHVMDQARVAGEAINSVLECIRHINGEECEVCSAHCSSCNSCVTSFSSTVVMNATCSYFSITPRVLVTPAVPQDRPPIYH